MEVAELRVTVEELRVAVEAAELRVTVEELRVAAAELRLTDGTAVREVPLATA